MKAEYFRYVLDFKRPSGTSRGVMTVKETFYIILRNGGKVGIGECGILRGLSSDDRPGYEEKLQWVCDNIHLGADALWTELEDFPSIRFGVETAFLSLASVDKFHLFASDFTRGGGIPINGLVWMGDAGFMKEELTQKLAAGFHCIKLKIGAIDFNQELGLLDSIRKEFSPDQIEIRLDANGAFSLQEASAKLRTLSHFVIHSIEQPIKAGQPEAMRELCETSPIAIALDEELIGINKKEEKTRLLDRIRPQYIILKPSLVGGFKSSEEWIAAAESLGINWWATSALESNIGLNAIAQWTAQTQNRMPQGLGTGALYTNNVGSPLVVCDGQLFYDDKKSWDLRALGFGDGF